MKRFSQETLAKMIDVDRSMISLYESAKSDPTELVIIRLSELFEVSADYVLRLVPFENETPKKIKH